MKKLYPREKLQPIKTKRNNRLLRDVPWGTVFAFVNEDVMDEDNGLYIKNQDDYITDLKTGRLSIVLEAWKREKIVEYDIKIVLVDRR